MQHHISEPYFSSLSCVCLQPPLRWSSQAPQTKPSSRCPLARSAQPPLCPPPSRPPQLLHTKTRDVLQKLRGIAGDGCVTQEVPPPPSSSRHALPCQPSPTPQALQATIPNAALLRFLFSLAQAEGLT